MSSAFKKFRPWPLNVKTITVLVDESGPIMGIWPDQAAGEAFIKFNCVVRKNWIADVDAFCASKGISWPGRGAFTDLPPTPVPPRTRTPQGSNGFRRLQNRMVEQERIQKAADRAATLGS